MSDLVLMLCMAVSAILFAITMALIVNSVYKMKHYVKCTGVIVGFYEGTSPASSDFGKKVISPVISYTAEGQKQKFIGNYCSTMMKKGQKIDILYDKKEPSKAVIQQGLYFAPAITGVLTLLSTMALIIFVMLKSKGFIMF